MRVQSTEQTKAHAIIRIRYWTVCFPIVMSEMCRFSWATIRPVFTELNYLDALFCCFFTDWNQTLRHLFFHKFEFCVISVKPLSSWLKLLIDVLTSLCFINQSNNFKHSYKRSDWFKLACFIRVQSTVLTTPHFATSNVCFENKVEFLKKITCSLSWNK